MERSELIRIRLELIRKELRQAKLIAVSKSTDIESIEFALEANQICFGENRVADLEEKAILLKDKNIDWHFIGNIQSNKLNRLLKIPNLKYIHSIDSFSVLEKLYQKEEVFQGESLGFFLQVNTSGEKEKQGFSLDTYDDLAGALNLISRMSTSKIKLAGLMTMGKIRTDHFEDDARKSFKHLRKIKKTISQDFVLPKIELSMGMSNDYKIAVEEGADYVRIGTALFKPQDSHN